MLTITHAATSNLGASSLFNGIQQCATISLTINDNDPVPTATTVPTIAFASTRTPTRTFTPTPRPTATRTPTVTSSFTSTVALSTWYISCNNLTGPLRVRSGVEIGTQFQEDLPIGTQVIRPDLIETSALDFPQYIRIRIYYPLGQQIEIAYVTIRDLVANDGEYLDTVRDPVCPTPAPASSPTYVTGILPAVSGTNNLLGTPVSTNRGTQVAVSNQPPPNDARNDRLYALSLVDFLNLDSGLVEESDELVNFVRSNLLTDGSGNPILQAGDYVFINSFAGPNTDYHGLIVVGWQSPQNCSVIVDQATPALNPNQLYASYSEAFANPNVPRNSDGNAIVVPYVADFTTAQSPIPRPFYCTRYFEPGKLGFAPHDWWFFHLPNQITLPYSSIYTNPSWQWSN